LPNGKSDTSISFRCCFANGRPITEMARRMAQNKWFNAVYQPPQRNHMILANSERQPWEEERLIALLPNGNKMNPAILKHWIPNGMPIMLAHKNSPPITYPNALKKPPKITQIILPVKFMSCKKKDVMSLEWCNDLKAVLPFVLLICTYCFVI
jgi:hypothetical protein